MLLKFIKQTKRSDPIEETASKWVARHDGGFSSKNDAQLFAQWMGARQEHKKEYGELKQVWDEMGEVADLLDDDFRNHEPDPDILMKEFGGAAQTRRPYFFPTSIAASILVLVGAVWLLSGLKQDPLTYSTAVGEVRTIALTDGSKVILNTNTKLAVNFDNNIRHINLTSGEAYFKVAKDPGRPFIVHAGHGEVKAVGTEFSVHRKNEKVEVVVAEGVVKVEMPAQKFAVVSDSGREQIVLRENQSTTYNGHLTEVADLAPETLKRTLSWQEKRLEFDNEPLSKVVKEIERYTNRRIFIASSELETLRIGGVYDTGDVDQLVDGLQDLFPIKAVKITPYFTILVATDTAAEIH